MLHAIGYFDVESENKPNTLKEFETTHPQKQNASEHSFIFEVQLLGTIPFNIS